MNGGDWRRRVDLGDVWRDDALTFPERRDAIVARLRPFVKWADRIDVADEGWEPSFAERLNELAEAEDVEEFDWVWSGIYDWADTDKRLWIDLWADGESEFIGGAL